MYPSTGQIDKESSLGEDPLIHLLEPRCKIYTDRPIANMKAHFISFMCRKIITPLQVAHTFAKFEKEQISSIKNWVPL